MGQWRYLRGWRRSELALALAELSRGKPNFADLGPEQMTSGHGWIIDGNATLLGREPAGPPVVGGFFERARQAVIDYDFSDPTIVEGHFDPASPLLGRNILLEIKVLGFHFLCGVRVHSVVDETSETGSRFGFRYDTLEGHIEQGFEWFLLEKDHASGEIRFKIEAHWRTGNFPTWWSQLGFSWLSPWMRRLWRNLAPERLEKIGKANRARLPKAQRAGSID